VSEEGKIYLSEFIKRGHEQLKKNQDKKDNLHSEYVDHIKSLTELNWDGNETRGREGEDLTE